MRVRAVRFQNFFSFGNELAEIRLDKTKTTVVVGKNGGGKSSSVLDTICYGLYGRPYRKVKLGQVVNTITGRGCLVEVDVESRGREYTVKRGQKPNLFEVWQDGVLMDQQSVKDQQEWLEKNVLGMDYRSFTQIVILGSANHVPFMQLPAAQRREVIEDILDIQVFSRMNEVVKERSSGLRSELETAERELAVSRRELEVEERHLQGQRQDADRRRSELADKRTDLEEQLGVRRTGLDSNAERVRSLTTKVTQAETTRRSLREAEGIETRLRSRLSGLESHLEHDPESCPSCGQQLDPVKREAERDKKRDEMDMVRKGLEVIVDKVRTLREREAAEAEVFGEITKLDREAVRLRSEVGSLEDRLHDISLELRDLNKTTAVDPAHVEELRGRVAELSSTRDTVTAKARVMAAAVGLLKDGGIKAMIVRQYIPVMNRLVNKYLAALELFVDFQLDDGFNETIRSRHRDTFTYESFSQGEKLRLDLAILFAWRDIARMRSRAAVDLLVFDEVLDGSLDAEGADYLMRLIDGMTDDCHVFVISHRDGLEDKFGRCLSFSKRQNFSTMSETGG